MGTEVINTGTYVPTCTGIDYTQYCVYRLPCGICTRTNQICPLNYGSNQPIITWTSDFTTSCSSSESLETTYISNKKISEDDISAFERVTKEQEADMTRMYETAEYKPVGLDKLKMRLL